MKKYLTILVFVFIFSFSSFAHSGRTDQYGGHYDRSTGEYHYHTGEYAGQKQYSKSGKKKKKNLYYLMMSTPTPSNYIKDMQNPSEYYRRLYLAIIELDDDEYDTLVKTKGLSNILKSIAEEIGVSPPENINTGKKVSYYLWKTSSNVKNSGNFKKLNEDKIKTQNLSETKTPSVLYYFTYFVSILLTVFVFGIPLFSIIFFIKMYSDLRIEFLKKKDEDSGLIPFTYTTNIRVLDLPPGVTINEDGLPVGSFETPKGTASYDVYVTPSGTSYHHYFCRYAHGLNVKKVNLLSMRFPDQKSPCSLCYVEIPTSWYKDAPEIKILWF